MINSDKLEKVVAEYKKYFPSHWEDEKYKWEAIRCFQDNWDIKAENFGEMFKKATDKTFNLLASGYAYPRGMILEFAKVDDTATRNMFINLFDENDDLTQRIETFINAAEEIRAKYDNGTWKKHYQNTNSVSTYLWLMYPDKYYIYKYELYKAVADELDDTYTPKRNGSVQNMIDGFKMYDEICGVLKADNNIRQMLHEAVTDKCYSDPELKTVTIDFGFYLARYYRKTSDKWFPPLDEYDPGLTTDDWLDLINDKNVFNEKSLNVIKLIYDMGGTATCKELSDKYGDTPQHYNSIATSLAKRIIKVTKLPNYNVNESKYWPVLFVGKPEENKERGTYRWKLRGELKSALEIFLNENPIAKIPATWLLNYNPNKWDWEKQNDEYSYKNIVQIVKNGGAVFFSWRCHSNQVKAGDRVFIIKLGPAPRGIFATGYATSEPYEGTYIDDNCQDVNGRMIVICITGFLDYHTEELISQGMLKQKFPDQQWSPYGSGISIKPDAARWLIENWNNSDTKKVMPDNPKEDILPASNSESPEHYTKDNFLKEVFITETEYDKLRSLLLKKKNIILQGAPGVGKTFSAKRLACSIIGEKNENRICMVQFHQNYSYEDFIMGYRPAEDGSFELRSGVFNNFCERCKENPDKPYFFIIDEINRGNLSKIFGELLMLIETDKRGKEHRVNLVYGGTSFYIPNNLHIIGMMNTADRSLAMIDYALRRRFSFYTMKPAFENADNNGFRDYMKQIDCKLYHTAVAKIKELNSAIRNDSSLGKGFEIGHSYFAPEDVTVIDDAWVHNVIEYEIIPLIEEYWFDDDKKTSDWTKALYQSIGEEYDG